MAFGQQMGANIYYVATCKLIRERRLDCTTAGEGKDGEGRSFIWEDLSGLM